MTVGRYLWERMDGFGSPGELSRFEQWLAVQIAEGSAEEFSASQTYADTLRERHFRQIGSDIRWRLVYPDPPFTGVFEPITA